MSRLRLMSQNQWNYTINAPEWEAKGLNSSAEVRMKGHVDVFEQLLPDVAGGQEVNAEMQKYFKWYAIEKKLPYTQIWGNYTPLFYRADKLKLLDTEYLLYPEQVEGYEGCFNDVLSKSCNLGVFETKEDGKVFIFAGTHLWWKNGKNPSCEWYQFGSDQMRTHQVKMAIALIEKYQNRYDNCPIIFGGDFNTGYDSEAVQYALKEGGFSHAHDVAVESACQVNGYNTCGPSGPGKEWQQLSYRDAIDHILVRQMPTGCVKRFERYMSEEYLLLSDHAPVYVDIEL